MLSETETVVFPSKLNWN